MLHNLRLRLRQAEQLSLELPLPLWAGNALGELEHCRGVPIMKRAALYLRVSTVDQHPESQLYDLRSSPSSAASNRSRIHGQNQRHQSQAPGLDQLLSMLAAASSTSF